MKCQGKKYPYIYLFNLNKQGTCNAHLCIQKSFNQKQYIFFQNLFCFSFQNNLWLEVNPQYTIIHILLLVIVKGKMLSLPTPNIIFILTTASIISITFNDLIGCFSLVSGRGDRLSPADGIDSSLIRGLGQGRVKWWSDSPFAVL